MEKAQTIFLLKDFGISLFERMFSNIGLHVADVDKSGRKSLARISDKNLTDLIKDIKKTCDKKYKPNFKKETWRQYGRYYNILRSTDENSAIAFQRRPYNTDLLFNYIGFEKPEKFIEEVSKSELEDKDLIELQKSVLRTGLPMFSNSVSLKDRVYLVKSVFCRMAFMFNNSSGQLAIGFLDLKTSGITLNIRIPNDSINSYSGEIKAYEGDNIFIHFTSSTGNTEVPRAAIVRLGKNPEHKNYYGSVFLGITSTDEPLSFRVKLMKLSDKLLKSFPVPNKPFLLKFRNPLEHRNTSKIDLYELLRLIGLDLAKKNSNITTAITTENQIKNSNSSQGVETIMSCFYFVGKRQFDNAEKFVELAYDKGLSKVSYLEDLEFAISKIDQQQLKYKSEISDLMATIKKVRNQINEDNNKIDQIILQNLI